MSTHSSASSSPSTDGAAYPWILEQLMAYPGTYEIPLRTMYTLNSAPSAQQQSNQLFRPDTPSLSSSNSSLDGSPQTPEFPTEQHNILPQANTDHFKQCLMDHISQLPSQPFSLPPPFITSFVRRCFTEDLCMVDFTQALTAMDYLKDLETRRRRDLSKALQNLGLDRSVADERKRQSSLDPRVTDWLNTMKEKDRKVEALYTQVYIGLRRWTLINEMRLEPFSKANSIAMLNTLYPPSTNTAPTRTLTPHVLASQRNAFFRYITAVEQNGKSILKNLEHQGQRPGDANGWIVVRDIVDKYLRMANGVIEDCNDVDGPDFFSPEAELHRRNERRADSGVSFATGDRPSTSSSNHSHSNASSFNKPLPASPSHLPSHSTMPLINQKRRETTLEKLAREFRNLRNRGDVKEISKSSIRLNPETDYHAPTSNNASKDPPKAGRGLRKMKSTSSIGSRENTNGFKNLHGHSRSPSSDEPMPDLDVHRRQKIMQARKEKESKALMDKANGNGVVLSRPGGGFEVYAR